MTPTSAEPTPAALARYFLRLGAVGFGGPAALADRMRRDLVDARGWIQPPEFELGLTLAAACPGPLAYQLAVYCGYARHGVPGAFIVGIAFALAPFLLVVAVAAGYAQWQDSATARGAFYGAGPVVVALVARASYGLGQKVLHGAWLAWTLALIGATVTWATASEPLWLFLLAGVAGAIWLRPASRSQVPRAATSEASPVPSHPSSSSRSRSAGLLALVVFGTAGPTLQLFTFFFQTGCLVFGSGLVIVPFLRSAVVEDLGWMGIQPFLDAVTIGLVSPGPVVITATFVGYVVARVPGAVAATVGMFLPAVLFTVIAAPWFGRYRHRAALTGLVRGVTAAVVGVLAGTVPLIATDAVPDWKAAAIMTAALMLVWRHRIPDPLLVAGGAMAGVALTGAWL